MMMRTLILFTTASLILASSENVVHINTQDDLVVEALPFKPGPSVNPNWTDDVLGGLVLVSGKRSSESLRLG